LPGSSSESRPGPAHGPRLRRPKRPPLEDLAGDPGEKPKEAPVTIDTAIKTCLKFKASESIDTHTLATNKRELLRLQSYCEENLVFTVGGISAIIITGFIDGWEKIYRASSTRLRVNERLSGFLIYFREER
jgi:hypothetical protein